MSQVMSMYVSEDRCVVALLDDKEGNATKLRMTVSYGENEEVEYTFADLGFDVASDTVTVLKTYTIMFYDDARVMKQGADLFNRERLHEVMRALLPEWDAVIIYDADTYSRRSVDIEDILPAVPEGYALDDGISLHERVFNMFPHPFEIRDIHEVGVSEYSYDAFYDPTLVQINDE